MKQYILTVILGSVLLLSACKAKKVIISGPAPFYSDGEIIQ